jgi:hypothetical protein
MCLERSLLVIPGLQLSTQYSVLTKIKTEEIHSTVRSMDSRRFDTRSYFTVLRIVRSIYASEGNKTASSVRLPWVFRIH